MTYAETIEFLYGLPVFQHIGPGAYKPGLDNILALEEFLGEPHRRFASVHVAGTNGKGSVSHMIASVLQAAGYRTGLFTSPHLKDFRERIRINGEMIQEREVISFVEKSREKIDSLKTSFFEATTALAFDYFAREKVDIAVIETGLGGRLDSTNVIRPRLSVITNISYDHMSLLGDTLEKIAAEKAGIIKEQTPVVVGESQEQSQLIFIDRAKSLQAPILFADQMYEILKQEVAADYQTFTLKSRLDEEEFLVKTDLLGAYQRKNILTALSALDVLNGAGSIPISPEAVLEGFKSVSSSSGLRGRWEVVSTQPLVVCDTGHNEGGITETVAQIASQNFKKLYMVLGFVSDKELERVLPLLPKTAHYLFTQASVERALDASVLAEQASRYNLQGEVVSTVKKALERARSLAHEEDMIYIGGSTFVVAEL